MLIKLKTAVGDAFDVEIDPNESILSIKEKVAQIVHVPSNEQRLVGTDVLSYPVVLEDDSIFSNYKLDSEEEIILIPRHVMDYGKQNLEFAKNNVTITGVNQLHEESKAEDVLEVPTKQTILKYTSHGYDSEQARKRIRQQRAAAQQVRNPLTDLIGSFFGFPVTQQVQPQTTTPPPPTPQPVALPQSIDEIQIDASLLQQLQDMGFPENRAKKALVLSRMNVQIAMEWLLEHMDDPHVDDPLTPQQLGILRQVQPSSFTPNPQIVQNLKDMGFAEDDINQALKAVGNNQEAACAWLLGEREEEEEVSVDGNLIHSVLTNPTIQASLANPRVLQALRTLMENPAAAAQFVNDPEIGPILLQVHNIISQHQ